MDDDTSKRNSDADSDLSDEEKVADSLIIDVYDYGVTSTKTLWNVVKNFPNIPQEQKKAWSKSVSRLTKSSVPTYKFALIGKTGKFRSVYLHTS